jgi:hypothetical protein
MKRRRIRVLFDLGFGPGLAAGSYTFTPLAVPFPGATQTIAAGIHDLDTIIERISPPETVHGFVLQKGTYTTLDPRGSTFTEATAIKVIRGARRLAFAGGSTADRSQSKAHRILPFGPDIVGSLHYSFW